MAPELCHIEPVIIHIPEHCYYISSSERQFHLGNNNIIKGSVREKLKGV